MAKMLTPWCKAAKIAMVEQDMTVNILAQKCGFTREWTSAVVNGRAYSDSAVKKISDALNIPDDV